MRLGFLGLLVLAAGLTVPPATAASGAVTITWSTHERTLGGDGRTYLVHAPDCRPATSSACVDYLARARPVVVFFHAAHAPEDLATAEPWLASAHSWSPETLFVFAVSKGGSRLWDGGLCCTPAPVDDIGYLERVVDNLALRWTIDRGRVGASGLSNGAMLALRAVCERPDLVAAAVALAGAYDGPCDAAAVRIGQWHGALDTTVPLEGGTVTVDGAPRTIPPVSALAERMAARSLYELRVRPGQGHSMTWEDYREATRWLVAHLPQASASASDRATFAVTVTWTTQQRTLADGRTYFVRTPECAPAGSPDCTAFLQRPRAVIIWLHPVLAPEDIETAAPLLGAFGSWSPDTIFVYGVSKDGSRRFDGGACCTPSPVDDVGYLVRIVDDIDAQWVVNRSRVGLSGFSNGGMLALRAACARPDVVRATASLSGSYDGECDNGTVRALQLHGGRDDTVPLNGGTSWIAGAQRTFSPAAVLSKQMSTGSTFELRVRPARKHSLPWADYRTAIRWLDAHFPR